MKSPESDSATEEHQPNTPIRSEKFPAMWQQRRHSLLPRPGMTLNGTLLETFPFH
jgi:hypothetical protein